LLKVGDSSVVAYYSSDREVIVGWDLKGPWLKKVESIHLCMQYRSANSSQCCALKKQMRRHVGCPHFRGAQECRRYPCIVTD
jgi:hypothetical protein